MGEFEARKDRNDFNRIGGWALYNKKKNCFFSAYNGFLGFNISEMGQKGFLAKRSININTLIAMKECIKKLKGATPGTSESIVFLKFDPNTKQSTPEAKFTFSKTNEGMYVLSFKDSSSETVHSFEIASSKGMVIGDNMKNSDRAHLGILSFEYLIDNMIPMAMVMSKRPFFPQDNNNNNNNKSNNTSTDDVNFDGTDQDISW
jgi:hypothetical protein